jgi:CRISP-associated protein Cas1
VGVIGPLAFEEHLMRTLHELPRFNDRWSYLYLEHGRLDQEAAGLIFHNLSGQAPVPIDQLSLLLLGPGSTVTHAAVKALAANSCLLAWVGEEGIRLYAHSTGSTFSARRLLRQARLYADERQRLHVVYRMYQKRFPNTLLEDKTIEQVRGMEGLRVRQAYETAAREHNIDWQGRTYDQDSWFEATAANRALSAANACLYGVCHAAIVSAGYSAAIGFIHTGKMLSFVYDVADLYKAVLIVPVAFRLAATVTQDLERMVRQECRKAFHAFRLMDRILPDIKEVLGAGDDSGETAEELEGRAVSLADGGTPGDLPGESKPAGP